MDHIIEGTQGNVLKIESNSLYVEYQKRMKVELSFQSLGVSVFGSMFDTNLVNCDKNQANIS